MSSSSEFQGEERDVVELKIPQADPVRRRHGPAARSADFIGVDAAFAGRTACTFEIQTAQGTRYPRSGIPPCGFRGLGHPRNAPPNHDAGRSVPQIDTPNPCPCSRMSLPDFPPRDPLVLQFTGRVRRDDRFSFHHRLVFFQQPVPDECCFAEGHVRSCSAGVPLFCSGDHDAAYRRREEIRDPGAPHHQAGADVEIVLGKILAGLDPSWRRRWCRRSCISSRSCPREIPISAR